MVEQMTNLSGQLMLEQAAEITSLKSQLFDLRSQLAECKKRAALVEAVDAFEIAVKLNSFREFNDHIPAMKVLLTRCKEVLSCS